MEEKNEEMKKSIQIKLRIVKTKLKKKEEDRETVKKIVK